jgi:hypothetical protein
MQSETFRLMYTNQDTIGEEIPVVDFSAVGSVLNYSFAHFSYLDALIAITFAFYLRIQITQRDSSSVIHCAFVWKELITILNNALVELPEMPRGQMQEKVSFHHKKMLSSGMPGCVVKLN